jgi:hypothetical protein
VQTNYVQMLPMDFFASKPERVFVEKFGATKIFI